MKILLATDGSESSEEAARFLTHLALTPQDQIIVLHVLSQIPYDDDYHARIKRVIRAVAPRVVRSTMQILQPVKANLRAIAIEGYPDTTIVETAVEEDADLIAMGARGVRGLKVLVLGSATRAVAINSPKHTLVVKKPLPGQGIRKVLFAYDGSNCAFLTGTFLAKIPFPEDTEAAVLHVTQTAVSDIPHQFIEKDESETIREIPEALREEHEHFENARKILSRRFKKIETFTRVGNPSMEILNVAETYQPDLIAIGSRGLRGLKGMLGSVSRNVLAYAHCSVLIGKEKT